MRKSVLLVAALLAAFICHPALADETVSVGGSRAVLIKPGAPRGSVILLPGGDGAIRAADNGDIQGLRGNQLVRTRHAYAARGLAVLVADAGTDLKSAVDYMAAIKRPVIVVGTSRGTLRAAEGIARGARPDALVLTSGFLSADSGSGSNVMSILGSPAALPRTLVIHHREGHVAGWRRTLHQMVGRTGAGQLADRRRGAGRSLPGRRPSWVCRTRWASRGAGGGFSLSAACRMGRAKRNPSTPCAEA